MQSYKFPFLLLFLISLGSFAQNPTIYLSEFSIKDQHFELPENLEGQNIFNSVFFIEKEIYEGGFKEKILALYNEELIERLKGEEIFFNTNFTFQYDLPGFYKNQNLKSSFSVSSKAGLEKNTKPNIFYVKDVIFSESGELESLILNKAGEEKIEDIYFSPRNFIAGSKVKIGTLADLGMINMKYLRDLEAKHKGKEYHLAFHNGRSIAIPDNVESPVTILNRTSAEQRKLEKGSTVSQLLVFNGLASRDPSWAFAGLLLDIGMRNSFNEQQRKMAEFRAKQRQLLYNFDITSNNYLSPNDFGPNIKWKFEDIRILEDSGTPVMVLKNEKGQKILVLEELKDIYLTDEEESGIIDEYGLESYLDLYQKATKKGQTLEMVRFAIGYQNYLAQVSEIDGKYQEAYAFGKEWYYFQNGLLHMKEWKNYRPEMEVFDQQSINTAE